MSSENGAPAAGTENEVYETEEGEYQEGYYEEGGKSFHFFREIIWNPSYFNLFLILDYEYEEGEEEEEGEGFSSFSENPLMQAMLARLGQLEGAKSSQPSTSTSPDQNGDNSLPSTSASSNNEANSSATNSRQNDVKIKTEPTSSTKQTTSNGGSRKSSQDGRTPSPSKLHFYSISNHIEFLKQV